MANDKLTNLNKCLNKKYKELNQRNGFVTAAISSDESIISEFGDANKNQLFEIGSVTKTMTASLIAKLIADNKIQLDTEIPLKYQKDGQSKITYKQLVSHTSGVMGGIFPDFEVQNQLSPYEGLSRNLFKDLYSKNPFSSEPGSKFEYSNIGYGLLGLLIEENFDIQYAEAVTKYILKPLQMNNSYFDIPIDLKDNFPMGSLIDANGNKNKMPHWDLLDTAINPAGGLKSTISDMIKYAQAHLNQNSVIKDTTSITSNKLFQLDKGAWVGMAWIVQPDKDLVWHNGMTYGYNSIIALSKTSDLAVVTLANTSILNNTGMDSWLQDVAFDCLEKNNM